MQKKTVVSLMAILGLIILVALWRLHARYEYRHTSGEVMVASLSTDGRYAITTDAKSFAILWDLQNKTKKILSRDADAYSAYWVKGTPYYMWQNYKTKVVHVTDVHTGQDVRQLHLPFIVFGQAMTSDLTYNVASDKQWNIWMGEGHKLHKVISHYDASPGFFNKLINFTIFDKHKVLTSGMTSGYNDDPKYRTGVFVWDLKTRKILHDFIGNDGATFATISPDNNYVIAGDDGTQLFVWNILSGKKIVHNVVQQPIIRIDKQGGYITDSNTITPPKDFYHNNNTLSIRYIDQNHYLVFTQQSPYVILYETTHAKPIKYISIGLKPMIATMVTERDQSMDTSPSAHILVTAKADLPGIAVYKYNPKTQTLKKIWVGQ